jgi:HSP20 family molecular chaperone IbpA
LTIRGRRATNDHFRISGFNEYADGDYQRMFTLSENIDRDHIEATLKTAF